MSWWRFNGGAKGGGEPLREKERALLLSIYKLNVQDCWPLENVDKVCIIIFWEGGNSVVSRRRCQIMLA